ncbi:MAG: lytic transglycosylase domain-containing protein [Gammaproteobacteria bacterium]|nr:lytic transglycosylase domain-containing protein [Gammaproteobacteria bacterium]MCP5196148.1 lytic transglycosylase domain-containing protein [Gammaproteobacteria bacterium]
MKNDARSCPSLADGRGIFILFLLVITLAIGLGGDVSATDSWRIQREAFQIAEQSLQAGAPVDNAALRDYPLYPYLYYQSLSRRLTEFPTVEVRDFLQTYPDTPLAIRLRNAWLRQLASARRWDDYLHDAIPGHDPTFECWRRQALLNTDHSKAALQDFATLWLRGRSLPNACDPVIAVWQSEGQPAPELRWQRFALAMTAGEIGLARFLQMDMSTTDRELANAWLAVADDPTLILDPTRFKAGDPRVPAILADGLNRWRRRDALAAFAALDALKASDPSLAPQLAIEERQLALWIASDYHPTALARLAALPETVVDQDVREWRIRVCLQQNDWPATLHWLDQLPPAEQNSPRWQYWRGRALESLGQTELVQPIYRRIANQRDYYGFLAASQLNIPYTIADSPLAVSPTELDALLAGSPGLQRARELYILGRQWEADVEWRQATQGFDPAALKQAAQLAHRWEWHHQAIITIARAEYWDDLKLRFPLAYRDDVIANARTDALDPAWIYAIIRQESAFQADARSPVGALGLMQMMPATGRQIARDLQDTVDIPDLRQPETNIRYGTHYLRRMLERLQDNPVLATAAYNAGPNKVAQWLPTGGHPIPADIWAETIPYRETRAYVQRVMEYAAVYRHLLGLEEDPTTTLGERMKPVLPLASTGQAG